MNKKIIIESFHDGQVVRFTLNYPKSNVLDSIMMKELLNGLNDLKQQPHVKLIQFTGAGDNFCFGASVPEHVREKAPEMLRQFHGLFHTLIDLAVPSAALVSGFCLGGGMEIALMCNFLFVDNTAQLGQPEITLGVFAPPASLILPLKAGQTKADEILLTGRSLSANEALETGLVTQLFNNKETMLESVDGWAEKYILCRSASSLKYAVRAARKQFNEILQSKLKQLEKLYNEELMATYDANEGIKSFMEKRNPEWENK